MRHFVSKTLERSEKYIKTDVRYLAKGSFWSIGNYLVTVGFGFLITIVLANYVPKDILGTYQFILAIASILAVCTLSGMNTAIVRAVAQGKDGVYRFGALVKLKWSIAIFLLSSSISIYYYINDDQTLALAFLIVGVTTPFIESFKLYEEYLRGKEAFKETVTLGFWRKPIPLLAIGITALLTDNLLLLISAYFFSHAIAYGVVFFQVNRTFTPGYEADADSLKLSKHLSLITIASQFAGNIDKIFIWHFLGPVAVASFTIAQITSRYASGIFSTVASIALPKISRQDFRTLQRTLPRKVGLFTMAMIVLALVYCGMVPLVFRIIFPEYPESIVIAQLLSILFVLSPSKVFSQALIAHDLLKAQYIITFTNPIIFGILLLVLTPGYGLLGATIAVISVSTLTAVLNYMFFKFSTPKVDA